MGSDGFRAIARLPPHRPRIEAETPPIPMKMPSSLVRRDKLTTTQNKPATRDVQADQRIASPQATRREGRVARAKAERSMATPEANPSRPNGIPRAMGKFTVTLRAPANIEMKIAR